MASANSIATELATLRALTFRISSTATAQLPQHVPAIASSLATCRNLLSSAQASTSKTASEASVAVHKYRTLLSTLLQDRTVQGRWAAIVLIKATIEIGGWETLQKALPWVRGLLGILTKPDPPSSKQLCIITITRIFFLTRDYPTLVREITTPSLSPFIQSTLQIAAARASPVLLEVIIEAYNQLLPRHPTTFRSHLKHIQKILNQTVATTPSSKLGPEQVSGPKLQTTPAVSEAARRLYTQLSCSAPKGAASEDWQGSFKKTIASVHRAGDKVFRAVVEDWKPATRDAPSNNGLTLDDEVQDMGTDALALPPWSGIFAGGERMIGLLNLVKDFLLCPTTGPVSLNVSMVVDLLTRLLSLTLPSAKSQGFQNAVKFNNQIGKEERENLWLILPKIHVAAIGVLLALTKRSDVSSSALDAVMLDQLVWVFAAEKQHPEIRTACYMAITQLLLRSGVALPKSSVDPLSDMIRSCCDDILPPEPKPLPKQNQSTAKTNGAQQASTNADSFLNAAKKPKSVSKIFPGVQASAYALLPVLFTQIRPQHLADSLRARMDRTVVLVGDKNGMIASVLNPPPSKKFGKPAASILPLLARTKSRELDIEALLRPRMPIIFTGTQDAESLGQEEADEDEEDEEVEEEVEDEDDDEDLANQQLVLESAANAGTASRDVAMAEAVTRDTPSAATSTVDAGAPERANVAAKRPQEEIAPHSPPKRMRVDVDQEELSHAATTSSTPIPIPIPIPTTVTAPALEAPAVVSALPVISQSAAQPTLVAPAAQPAAASAPDDGDSDDEDIVPLVFGQDTDSESD